MIEKKTISIIIPVYREEDEIENCLNRLEKIELIETAEVVVVDGFFGSTIKGIEKRKRKFNLITIISPAGRGIQLHAGAVAARGVYLMFLHVDTVVRKSTLPWVIRALSIQSGCAFDLYVMTKNYYVRSVAVVATIRSRLSRIPYGDQVHCVRSEVYRALGGYSPLPIMEDIEFMTRLKHAGYRISFGPTFAINPDRRWKKEGPLRNTLRNWFLVLSYRAGIDPKKLAGLYRPQPEAGATG